MQKDKIIICPQGWAIHLDDIRTVSPVENYSSNGDTKYTHFVFKLYHKHQDKWHGFWYKWADFSDSKEELLIKVQNIRYEIIKLMNNGNDVKPISGIIKLKKKNG